MSKETKKTMTQKLRFPEFQEAGEWAEKTVGYFFNFDKKAKKAEFFDKEKILTVKLHTQGVVKNERATSLTGGANYFKRRSGEFIFSKIDLLNGAFGIVPMDLDGYVSSTDVPAYSFKENCDPIFFINWLKFSYSKLQVERTGTSNTLKRVSPENFFNLKMLVPIDVSEQQKIAATLSSLDDLIAAQSEKIKALQAHKKGLMQRLFPAGGETVPRVRFAEFWDAGEWVAGTLGDICKITSGGTPNRAEKDYWDSGNIPWITTTLIDSNIINEANEFITEKGLQNSSAKIFPKNTILMAMYGQGKTRGKVAILGIEAATNQACAAIILKGGFNTNFVFQYLAGRYEKIRELSNSGGQENLSAGLIESIPFAYPNIKTAEQQKIAACLTSLDDLIAARSEKLEDLKAHKKGLMQQLFPNPNDIDE
ncbi:MAG: restriction endonuclease subunit S [Saprospiraceae bacterium]|nr:restriction endonuclease subunit S [Saprospiraceae bacterium]